MKGKRLLTLLGIATLALAGNFAMQDKVVNAEETDVVGDLNALVTKYYNEGVYRKETVINLTDAALDEIDDNGTFHANATDLVRVTKYNGNQLTMTIPGKPEYESSYGTDAEGNLTQWGKGGTPTVAVTKPVDPENAGLWRNPEEDGMEGYYWTLKDIVAKEGHEWTVSSGTYTSTNPEVIEWFKAVVAPCYIGFNEETENYITFEKVTIKETQKTLQLRLYAVEGDYSKLTSESGIFAQAYITEEHHLQHNYTNSVCNFCGGSSEKLVPDGDSTPIWYNKDNNEKWTSGDSGTTAQTYSKVTNRITNEDGEIFNNNMFVLSATPLSTGKFMNFAATSSSFKDQTLYCIYGAKNDKNKATIRSEHDILSVNIKYVSDTHYKRATVYSGNEVVKGIARGSNTYTYIVNDNSFSIENASGETYLYLNSIEIIYKGPSYHTYGYNETQHWYSCHESEKEDHNLVNHLCECGYTDLEQYQAFNVSPCRSSALLWNKDGEWFSGADGTTERDYNYVIGRVRSGAIANKIDSKVFSVVATTAPSLNGKWANFSGNSGDYEGNELCLFGKSGEKSAITFNCTGTVYSITITYAAKNQVERAAIYTGTYADGTVAEATKINNTTYSYLIDSNSFTIENVGQSYLYIDSINILYSVPQAQ